jgi:hypothetical protein
MTSANEVVIPGLTRNPVSFPVFPGTASGFPLKFTLAKAGAGMTVVFLLVNSSAKSNHRKLMAKSRLLFSLGCDCAALSILWFYRLSSSHAQVRLADGWIFQQIRRWTLFDDMSFFQDIGKAGLLQGQPGILLYQ